MGNLMFDALPVETILAYALTDFAICLVPGPAVMITVAHAMSGGPRNALGPIAGINSGNLVWFGLSAAGLATLASTAPAIFMLIQYVGTAYLIWMGIRRWQTAQIAGNMAVSSDSANSGGSFWAGYASGIAVHMANPKALLFYTTILPQFIDPTGNVIHQIIILAVVTLVTETTSLSLYSYVAGRGGALVTHSGKAIMINRLAGLILIGVAVFLAILNWQN